MRARGTPGSIPRLASTRRSRRTARPLGELIERDSGFRRGWDANRAKRELASHAGTSENRTYLTENGGANLVLEGLQRLSKVLGFALEIRPYSTRGSMNYCGPRSLG
jgi:hypothetical protein